MIQLLMKVFGSFSGGTPYDDALLITTSVIIVFGFTFLLKCVAKIFEI